MQQPTPPIWYLPTFHGDIRLEAKERSTILIANELTPTEMAAMRELRKRAISPPPFRRPWATAVDFPALDTEFYRTGREQRVELKTSIATVQAFLAPKLKPGRALLGAVRFSDGEVREIFKTEPKKVETYRQTAGELPPAKDDDEVIEGVFEEPEPKAKKTKPAKEKPAEKEPAAAATVAAPVLGCPAPDFPQADVRANRVLDAFLTEQQRQDWKSRGQIVTVGADTGHRYMLTSRERRDMLERFGGRSLFDLDAQIPVCTHDWDVPAAEEILALLLFVSLPTREKHVRFELGSRWAFVPVEGLV